MQLFHYKCFAKLIQPTSNLKQTTLRKDVKSLIINNLFAVLLSIILGKNLPLQHITIGKKRQRD